MFTHYRVATYQTGSYQWYVAVWALPWLFGFVTAFWTNILGIFHWPTSQPINDRILQSGEKDVKIASCFYPMLFIILLKK
jgi:hypothetical protein